MSTTQPDGCPSCPHRAHPGRTCGGITSGIHRCLCWIDSPAAASSPPVPDSHPDLRALLDQLDQAHAAASVIGVLSDDEHRARLEAEWAVVQALPTLVAAVRAVADLADQMDAELEAQGFVLDRCILPGDRLRAALAPLTAEDQA